MMHLSLVLWAISSCTYIYAISIPPFIYTSTPLSYDDAELYCQSKYGTDLATIKTMPDRWAAINVINVISGDGDGDAGLGRIWTGLRNTREIGWFNFFEPDVECPMPFTGACVKFWRKDGKPRCHMRKKNGDGFECTVFYLDENLIDNDVNCSQKLPFLCNQQYDYTFGSELPAPGDVYQIKDGHGSGYIKLSENVKYLHQSHTLQCVIEYDEDDNVLHESFVEITKEMYGSTDIGIDSILLATGPIFNLLPPSCTRVPAVKVIDLIELSNSVKLYIKEAALFEYIPEMDIDGTNYQVFGNGEEAPITIPNPEEEFANNNITNGSFNIYTLTCAVYDVDGFQIGTEDPVDGKCNGKTVFDEYGGTFGDGFNTNTDDRRRLWGWFKKAINWVEKKIVKPVTKVFRVIVSLITGNIDERVFDSGLYIDEKVQYKISGNQNLYAPKNEEGQDKKLSVSIVGTFKMQAGVKFIFNVYADLKAKYKIWTLKPSFDYFKFVLGANNEFDAYVNMEIQGGVRINYKLLEKSARKVFMLGPVPVVIKLHGDLSVGIDIKLDLVISQSVGYEPLFVRYGVEYIKGSGWKKISDSNLQFIPRKKFGGEVEDSLSCPKFTVEPFVALNVGVTFYEIVDVWLRTTASLPTSISWPDTCDTTPSCNHDPHQLKFGISFSINMDIGLAVKVPLIGLTIAAKSWHIWDKSWPLADVCTNLEIASLSDVCCATGIPVSTSTSSTIATTTEEVSISMALVKDGATCASQIKNLGNIKTPQECAVIAATDPACSGNQFMFSDSYGYAWGCRCCPTSNQYGAHAHWDVYRYAEKLGMALVKDGATCASQIKNLGNIKNPEECAVIAATDPACTGNQFMFSDSYGYVWGCRCCPTSYQYGAHAHWDVYEYSNVVVNSAKAQTEINLLNGITNDNYKQNGGESFMKRPIISMIVDNKIVIGMTVLIVVLLASIWLVWRKNKRSKKYTYKVDDTDV